MTQIDYFTRFFELGLTIRGWKSGTPYISLNQKPNFVESDIVIALCEFSTFTESLPLELHQELGKLPLMLYSPSSSEGHSRFVPNSRTIQKCRDDIVMNNFPCLVAANFFISTAIFYLKERCQTELPDVDISQFQSFC